MVAETEVGHDILTRERKERIITQNAGTEAEPSPSKKYLRKTKGNEAGGR